MTKMKKAVRRDKWVDRIIFLGGDDAFRRHWSEKFGGEMPQMSEHEELSKTYMEIAIWDICVGALNRVLAKLEQPAIFADFDRLHVLETAVFDKDLGANCAGKFQYGHVYVRRVENAYDLVGFLCHELVHLASRFELTLAPAGDRARIESVREGHLVAASDDDSPPLFLGLNEAVTEQLASMVRREVLRSLNGTSDENRIRLSATWCYEPQIMVVTEACNRLAAVLGLEPRQTGRFLFRGYFNGSNAFVRKLRLNLPETYAALRDMGDDAADARRAAEILGYDAVLERLGPPAPEQAPAPAPEPPKDGGSAA